jgi:hypothetical protein
MDEPITEDWLAAVGFKWHQLDRQPGKQWLLWLGAAAERKVASFEDLGIELGKSPLDDRWCCWLRSDVAHRYSRFIHVRHLKTQDELIRLIEGLTGRGWNPENNLYGSMQTPEEAEFIRREEQRLDHQFLREGNKWMEIERDDTSGGALPEHKEGYEKFVLRRDSPGS